jgi:probable phosphoglycerate mutase
MPLRLFVIRHGETEWSLSGQHSGRADILLTENGKAEARQLGQRIRNVEFSYVLVSPLSRAMQTCQIAGLGKQAKVDADLSEWDNGDYEGRTGNEIRALHPGWNLFQDGCPNGESPIQISDRVDRLVGSLRELSGDVAIFTHSHLARVLVTRWIGAAVKVAQHFLLDTASLSILCYEHAQQDQPAILLWNSSSIEEFVDKPSLFPAKQNQLETSELKRRAIERWENEGGELLVTNEGKSAAKSKRGIRVDPSKRRAE